MGPFVMGPQWWSCMIRVLCLVMFQRETREIKIKIKMFLFEAKKGNFSLFLHWSKTAKIWSLNEWGMKQRKQTEGKEIYMKANKKCEAKINQFFPFEAQNVFFHLKWEKWSKMMQKTYLEAKLNIKKQRNEFYIAWVLKKEAKWIQLRFILLETGAPGLICADCWSSSIAYSLHKQGSC